jgi:uncharacterized surface protein with fasciclin (FAS1) repeats
MPQFTQALTTISNITILAPSNDAFEQAVKEMPNLRNDMNMFTALLQYHVLSGVMMGTAFTEMPQFVSTCQYYSSPSTDTCLYVLEYSGTHYFRTYSGTSRWTNSICSHGNAILQ